ncbi:dTMP kinase [Fructilactobacillus frigidiflavus]|uniref:dTMP kinase n=1 Tax=Fructilactobacillus frigidiflavus TaxID=3242688 RepID=UPI003756CD7E
MNGKLITFEGSEGAGKTTALNEIIKKIKPQLGNQLVTTREPGGNVISEEIRNIIMDSKNDNMDARTEALLFAAARRQHLVDKVIPALTAGKLVLCDRYVESSVAYQGVARGIGEQAIWDLNQFATDGLKPDLTVYFDVPIEVGLERIMQHRTNEINRLDQQQHDFYVKVHDAYEKIAADHPEQVVKIDATQSVDQVVADVLKLIETRVPEYFN